MTRLFPFVAVLLVVVLALPSTAFAADLPNNTKVKVEKIKSGDVLVVRLKSGKRAKVRILGINCGSKATSAAAALVGRKKVVLQSDKSFLPILQDQMGRYVAYVQMSDGRDLGLELLKSGQCSTSEWTLPHPRATEYASVSK